VLVFHVCGHCLVQLVIAAAIVVTVAVVTSKRPAAVATGLTARKRNPSPNREPNAAHPKQKPKLQPQLKLRLLPAPLQQCEVCEPAAGRGQ
jgi:hypothetical protein